jgi:hypothetical protein
MGLSVLCICISGEGAAVNLKKDARSVGSASTSVLACGGADSVRIVARFAFKSWRGTSGYLLRVPSLVVAIAALLSVTSPVELFGRNGCRGTYSSGEICRLSQLMDRSAGR